MAYATPAAAGPITMDSSDIDSSFTIDFDGFANNSTNTVDGLSGSITFTLEEITSGTYTFGYKVDNTSSDGVASKISSFAFNVDPDIVGASSDGAYNYSFVTDGRASDPSYPNQVGAVDVCFKAANSGSCSNSSGVSEGSTGSGSLSLFFGSSPSEITLSDFFVRYQGISGAGDVTSASGQQVTSSTTGGSSSGTQVPAPGMVWILGLVLLGLGFLRRPGRWNASDLGGKPAFA
nr:cistern family PEP-CTERM protein [Aurantiacibacter rhizosphaerae]